MQKIVTKAQIWGILCNLLLIIISYTIRNVDNKEWLILSAILYVVSFIINICFIKRINNKKMGYFIIIYAIMVTLHLAQIFLPLIGDNSYQNVFLYSSMKVSIRAFTYSYVCIHLMTLSYYIFANANEKDDNEKKDIVSVGEKKLIVILFYIFYFLKIAIMINVIITSKQSGYLEALKEITSIRSTIVSFANIIAMVYLNFCVSTKKKKQLLIIIIIIEIVSMISGSRLYSVVYLLLLLITVNFKLDNNKIKKINLNKKIFFFICVIALLSFSTGLRYAREGGGDISYENIMKAVKNHNIVVETIKEFGATQIDTIFSIENEGKYSHTNGRTYMLSFLTILPNINGFYDGQMKELYFTNILSEFYALTYGGSNIAESFINFGNYGIIVFFILGFVLSKMDMFILNLKNKNITLNIFVLLLAYQIMLWSRGYFSIVLRNPIWLTLFYIMIKSLFVKKRENETY